MGVDDGPRAGAAPDAPHAHQEEPAYAPDEALQQYAYESGLTRDYTLSSFSAAHLLAEPVQSTMPTVTECGFTDCSHLPDLELPAPRLRGELLSITHSALKLVHEIRCELTHDEVEKLTRDITGSGTTRRLELELPMLRTNNERDLREFHRQIASRRKVNIGDHRLPLDPADVEDGEGMQLPAPASSEAKGFLTRLEGEKLGVTRSSLQFLSSAVRDEYTEEEQSRFLMEQAVKTKWVKNTALEKLEAPINLLSHQNKFEPANDAHLIPIPSDPSSSIFADDLKAAEEQLFKEFGDAWSEPTSPILDNFLDTKLSKDDERELLNEISHEQSIKRHLDDHKIDLPILSHVSPEDKSLLGPEKFASFVAKEMHVGEFTTGFVENFPGDNFEHQLANVAGPTMRTMEQEQLQAADAIARVPVPIMDFSVPEPEWTRLGNNGEAIFKWIQCGNDSLFRFPKWPRDSAAESKMIWKPIGSGGGAFSADEEIQAGDAVVESLIAPLDDGEVPSSLGFIQKRDRLVVLDHNTEDDEIEPQVQKPKRSNSFAIDVGRKRPLDAVENTNPKKLRSSAVHTGENGQSLLLGGSPGASAKLLSNFMELHAPKKWSVSKYFPSVNDRAAVIPASSQSNEKPHGPGEPKFAENAEAVPHSKLAAPAPCPSLKPMLTPPAVFISLNAPRHLIRSLERLLPGITLVERDYNKHNTSVWSPGSVHRTEVVPPLAFDADLTLSPSTGLVTTSMIMVRQKPRPQSAKNGLQERIEKTCLRYNRLIILVGGQGGPDDSFQGIASSDAAALTDLQGFASGLECNIQVYYIGGGNETLSRWVASLVCRYGQSDSNMQNGLTEAETLWELWLRRAGFNVYAAQMVAATLRVPKIEKDGPRGQHGLAAFATMTRGERMRRFEPMVGPLVLERVSQTVDEIWNKA